jgi:hypothetical protein
LICNIIIYYRLEFRVAANVDQVDGIGYKTKQTFKKKPDYSAWYNIIKPDSTMKAQSNARQGENKKSSQNHKPLLVDSQSLLFRSVKEKWLAKATVSSWLESEWKTPSRAYPSAETINRRRLEVSTELPCYTQIELPSYTQIELPHYTQIELPCYTQLELPRYTQTELPCYTQTEVAALPKLIPTKLPMHSIVPCFSTKQPSQTAKLCSIPELPTFPEILSPIQFNVDNAISNHLTSQSAKITTGEEIIHSNLTHSGNVLPLEAEFQLTDTQFNCMGPLEVSSYIEVQTSNRDNYLDTSSADIKEIQNINAEIEDLVTGRSEFGCTNDVETDNLTIAKGAKASSKVIFDDSGIGMELNSKGQVLTVVDSSSTPEINADHSYCPKVSLPQTSFISQQQYEGYSMGPTNFNYGQPAMTGYVETEQQSKGKNMNVSSDMEFVQPIGSCEDGSMIDNIETIDFNVAETSLDVLMQR